jgi:outer membrane protein
MRVAYRILAAVLLCGTAVAQGAGEVRAELTAPPQGGRVRVLLFDSAVTFGRFSEPYRVAVFPADGRASYALTGVPAGTYALVVHHDENDNGQFDKNFIGIPIEPIAISRGYRPKGPPIFAPAAFTLADGQVLSFELELRSVFGPRGLLGVGAGVIGRSSPYVDGGSGVFQPIPIITYTGEDLQWFGPTLRYGLTGSDDVRLAVTASYRLGAYDENDSPALAGLGDRDSTLMAGLAVVAELPAGVNLSLGYEHDVLDQLGGGEARLVASRSFQWGLARFGPNLGLRWSSADLADYDFGVPVSAATPTRPAYEVGDTWTVEAGVSSFIELSRSWRIVFDVAVEFLPDEVSDSPIVADDHVVRGFIALTYVF